MKTKQKIHFSAEQLEELISITKIGCWIWNLKTNDVIYSKEWAEIVGYQLEDLSSNVSTWERMVLPEDLPDANISIEKHLAGKVPNYEAEFRMVKKDGSIIWGHDKGRITEFDIDGSPLILCGVLQDITQIKLTETKLRESQEILNLAISVAEFGTWDWDLPANHIKYNDEYLHMLGYTQEDIDGSIAEWESMNHPEDLPNTVRMLDDYLSGKTPKYECEIRMLHKDGHYIWTRDVGQIIKCDAKGTPTRLIGGHLNIDNLKQSQGKLSKALKQLEDNQDYLEKQIELRTKTLVEQDKMLLTVNNISQKLVAANSHKKIDDLICECLEQLCKASGKTRMSIWRNKDVDNKLCCYLAHEWNSDFIKTITMEDIKKIFADSDIETATGGKYKNSQKDKFYTDIFEENEKYTWDNIIYEQHLPSFLKMFKEDKSLNTLSKNLTFMEHFYMSLQGIKALLVSPIHVNGKPWGFIGIDDCENEKLFSEVEENMLSISGSLLANAIQKSETDEKIREAEKLTKLMFNAIPLCCNLWDKNLENIDCNDEAVRLFDLNNQEEYLAKFHALSPKFQPCGKTSLELAMEYVNQAFSEGYCRFEWLHQKLNGEPIPTEVTLVRIKHNDDYIVAGYTRDLREFKTMLTEITKAESELRLAHEEALLSSQAKTNFLANMSHEIRTPMNAISGMAEIILRESQGRAASDYAQGIKNACDSLLNIINDILDISKIESGKLEINNAKYNLASLLSDVINIVRMRFENKSLMFITYIDSKLPTNLFGDEIRIKQVLINLLNNAIKFTPSGHIAFRVTGTYSNGKANLVFEIIDTGIGIKEQDLERLFVEFERINTKKNRSIEGTGLGLAISKQLCEMMGGYICVKSTFGQGSIFTVQIPQEYSVYEPVAAITEKKSVLVYEARELYLSSICESINNLDCECTLCTNQSDLYENLNENKYSFIFTSPLHYKKVQALKEQKKITAKIVLMSDFGNNKLNDNIYTIILPANCIQIANVLNNTASINHIESSTLHFIAPEAKILIVDDNPVNLKVASGLMEPYQFNIETALNGVIAVEMVQQNKYDLVFMDHMMPEMDGIDATAAIRKMTGEYYQNLPIVALTANAIVGTKELFIKEGMNDFLAKPIELNKLNAMLAKWLPKEKQITIYEQDTKNNENDTQIKIPGINTSHGIKLIGCDLDSYIEILNIYYTDGIKRHLSILNSYKTKDIPLFKMEVHALKSASASIGALIVSTKAQKLEQAAATNDWGYIENNVQDFLNSFDTILENIRLYTKPLQKETSAKKSGDITKLKDTLEELTTAIKFANIAKIEKNLEFLLEHKWQDDLTELLKQINDCIASFDYDTPLTIIETIKTKINQ